MMDKNKEVKMEKEKSVVVVKTGDLVSNRTNAELLISQAIDAKCTVETMEKLLAMRRELKAERAKEDYNAALSRFQADCPTIKKTISVKEKTGGTRYKYAPLDEIIRQVKDLLRENGFSYTFDAKFEPAADEKKAGAQIITCTARHIGGHSETAEFRSPVDVSAYMSEVQKHGAAMTFAKRYAFCEVFGIMTGDDDTDGISQQNGGTAPKQRVSFPEGAKPLNPAKKPENKAKSPFVLNGKPSTRQHYIDTLDFNCKKHGIDISRMVEDSEVNKDFVDMSDAEVLKVGKFVFAEIKKLLKKND